MADAKPVKNILAIRTDRLGDVVLTLPACSVLKKKYPDAKLYFLTTGYTAALPKMYRDVDEVVVYDPEDVHSGPGGILRLARALRALEIDLAVLFYPRPRLALALALSGIPVRVGTGYRWYSPLLNRKVYKHRKRGGRHELECNLDLLEGLVDEIPSPDQVEFNFELGQGSVAEAGAALEAVGVAAPYAIIHPGSGDSSPNLPEEQFGKLAAELASRYNMQVLVAGAPSERELVERVAAKASGDKRVIPFTGLGLTAYMAVIARSSFFASNSTGPLHIARAFNVPVLGFYCLATACAPTRWRPYNREQSVLTPGIAPCDRCDREKCEHGNCLELIPWEEISERTRLIIEGDRADGKSDA